MLPPFCLLFCSHSLEAGAGAWFYLFLHKFLFLVILYFGIVWSWDGGEKREGSHSSLVFTL